MNALRIIIGDLFQSPMSNMSFPAYINYVNTAGKISQRSMLELETVILTMIEHQEKVNQENEENFKQIFEILAKLVQEKPIVKPLETFKKSVEETAAQDPLNEQFVCPLCTKNFSTKLALSGHSRSHKPKV